MSAPAMRKRRGEDGGGLWGGLMAFGRVESAVRVGTQADMFSRLLRGGAVADLVVPRRRGVGSAAVGHGVQRRDDSTLSKWIVMQSKDRA
ncbi:hypothetical protein GCM10022232_67310 [Streptomyces plumbiresistens]|uniref:Uncharacterized protein n=1 Tax=Streptomyces plumbiresistens TaxID=511811 RepID=A0ABP7SQG2_9ACTN